jgi:hypothetical protein
LWRDDSPEKRIFLVQVDVITPDSFARRAVSMAQLSPGIGIGIGIGFGVGAFFVSKL